MMTKNWPIVVDCLIYMQTMYKIDKDIAQSDDSVDEYLIVVDETERQVTTTVSKTVGTEINEHVKENLYAAILKAYDKFERNNIIFTSNNLGHHIF